MRVLVTTNDAMGHFAPLVPTIRAMAAAGHEVRVGCLSSFADTVARAGLEAMPCLADERVGHVPAPPPPDQHSKRLAWAVSQGWPARGRRWAASLLDQASDWRPDVVVVEPVEHAGRVVAAALGVPYVEHGWGVTLPSGLSNSGSRVLRDLYSELGAAPVDPVLSVDLGAARIQPTDAAEVPRYRYEPWSQGCEPPSRMADVPRVLVTLGTFDNPDAADRIQTAVAAALACGTEVLAVLGNADRGLTAAPLDGAIFLEWVDLPAAVRTCELVIHHAGAGTSWVTLLAGCPSIAIPQMGDQFRNAEVLVRTESALVIEQPHFNAASLISAITRILGSPTFAQNARTVAAENAALPPVDTLSTAIVESTRAGGQ